MSVALDGPRVQTEGGLTDFQRWKLAQPGFMTVEGPRTTTQFKYNFRENREVDWDGTFNMPVMPLADPKSKLSAGVRWQ